MKTIGTFCLILSTSLVMFSKAFAQEDTPVNPEINPRHSFSIELGLPKAMGNKAYNRIMQGLVQIAPEYQFTTNSGLSFAGGVRYSALQINQFKSPGSVTGYMQSYGLYGKLAFEKFITKRVGIDLGCKVGYAINDFVPRYQLGGALPRYSNDGSWIEPTASVMLNTTEHSAFSWVVSYAVYGYRFKTFFLGIDSTGGYTAEDLAGRTQQLTVGFAYSYFF